MSDFTNRTEDAVRELCVRADLALRSAAQRLREQRGQTAAEYMGLLLIIALIIGVLFASGIGEWIKNGVEQNINKIKDGKTTG